MTLLFAACFAGKYKDNEAIEFSFDLNKDVPEDVAQEMVGTAMTYGGRTFGKRLNEKTNGLEGIEYGFLSEII